MKNTWKVILGDVPQVDLDIYKKGVRNFSWGDLHRLGPSLVVLQVKCTTVHSGEVKTSVSYPLLLKILLTEWKIFQEFL